MWIFTTIGFFSVVANRRDGSGETLLVRARRREHIDAAVAEVRKHSKSYPLPVIQTTSADYPWRVVVAADLWAETMQRLTQEIDYDNFKGAVGRVPVPDVIPGAVPSMPYLNALHDVWGVMRRIESPRDRYVPEESRTRPRAKSAARAR